MKLPIARPLVIAILCGLSGCASLEATRGRAHERSSVAPQGAVNAVYWVQQSAEYEATTRMVYAAASEKLDVALSDLKWSGVVEQFGDFQSLPPAVILDVDETVLDNSAFMGALVKGKSDFSNASFGEFMNEASSPPIQAALEFTKYAASKGVTVFYVTNRPAAFEGVTLKNLERHGFPLATDVDPVLLRGEHPDWGAEKGSRREFIAKHYRVLLLVGDNLGDFVDGIETTPEMRHAIVVEHQTRFGTSWFILPNPMYGSWEDAAYGFDSALSREEVRQALVRRMRAVDEGE